MYEIMVNPSTVWPSSDTRVYMYGSIGFYELRIDKTVAANGQIFYLRAKTTGLVVAS